MESKNKKTEEFKRGYALGKKHAEEYYEALLKENTEKKSNVEKIASLLYDNNGAAIVKTGGGIYDDILTDGDYTIYTQLDIWPGNSFKFNTQQKQLLSDYLNNVDWGNNVMPIVKKEFVGVTSVLMEIAFREMMNGKRVIYFTGEDNKRRCEREVLEKAKHSKLDCIGGGDLYIAHADGINYYNDFNCEITSKTADVLIVDEVPLTSDFGSVLSCVYCFKKWYPNCKVIFAFTIDDGISLQGISRAIKYVGEMEKCGALFRCEERLRKRTKREGLPNLLVKK